MTAVVERWQLDRTKAGRPRKHQPLSVRHRQILVCRCKDELTNEETGDRLGISSQTVKNHVTKLLATTGFRTMQGACFRFGRMLGPDEPVDSNT